MARPTNAEEWRIVSDTDIERMRDLRRNGVPLKAIAAVFGMCGTGYMSRICNGHVRKHARVA